MTATTPVLPARGEVWWCELPELSRRPVVVLSRDMAIKGRRYAIVAPCTTTVRGLPTEVVLRPGEDPVPRECVASLDSVENISISMLVERLGRLSDVRVREACAALAIAVDCAN